jgi:hypothetical protein
MTFNSTMLNKKVNENLPVVEQLLGRTGTNGLTKAKYRFSWSIPHWPVSLQLSWGFIQTDIVLRHLRSQLNNKCVREFSHSHLTICFLIQQTGWQMSQAAGSDGLAVPCLEVCGAKINLSPRQRGLRQLLNSYSGIQNILSLWYNTVFTKTCHWTLRLV